MEAISAVSTSHRGNLREENIALRQTLGYSLESIESFPYMLPTTGQYISGTPIKDLLIIAIDVDKGRGYDVTDTCQSFHVGISILDTRCLVRNMTDLGPDKAITSYQFTNATTSICAHATKNFLFGKSSILQSFRLLPSRIFALTKTRNYILVAHGTTEDIKFLNALDPNIVSGASYIFDTVKVAQFPLQLEYRYSLEKLLLELGVRYARLHAAGNDAHFALKALLMLAVRDGRKASEPINSAEKEEEERLFRRIEDIVHAPCGIPSSWTIEKPPHLPPPVRKEVKKLGVKEKGRLKRQSKATRLLFRELPFADDSSLMHASDARDDCEDPDQILNIFEATS